MGSPSIVSGLTSTWEKVFLTCHLFGYLLQLLVNFSWLLSVSQTFSWDGAAKDMIHFGRCSDSEATACRGIVVLITRGHLVARRQWNKILAPSLDVTVLSLKPGQPITVTAICNFFYLLVLEGKTFWIHHLFENCWSAVIAVTFLSPPSSLQSASLYCIHDIISKRCESSKVCQKHCG